MPKTLLIIGAGPGMSLATAERFGREGWHIVLAARNEKSLARLVSDLRERNVKARSILTDGGDLSSLRRIIRETAVENELAAILCNIGSVRPHPLSGLTDESIISILKSDIAGAFVTVQAAELAFDCKGGAILIAGGGYAMYPDPDFPLMSAAKAAVRNFVQGYFPVLQAKGILLATLTICAAVKPGSKEANEVADRYWNMVEQPLATTHWEVVYPQPI